ncbi:hypothetical protein J4E89_008077 [Alternaria sp. Ai002NY15]|nr:hypothetical protein J4E89_008077 [Alternaria sp. Ai002NY15]
MTARAPPRKRKAEMPDMIPETKNLRRSVAERPSLQSDITTVIVGTLSKVFPVDKKLLRTSTTFFDNQPLAKKGKAAVPNQVTLPDTTGRAFRIYLSWLQTGYFYIVGEDPDDTPLSEDEPRDHFNDDAMSPSGVEYEKWYECYKLGHNIKDVGFQDACIDLSQEMITSGKDMVVVQSRIYNIDDGHSVHRKFAVDIAAHLWKPVTFHLVPQYNYPRHFTEDLLQYFGQEERKKCRSMEQPAETFFKDVGCKYHAHVALKKPCYKETHPAYK